MNKVKRKRRRREIIIYTHKNRSEFDAFLSTQCKYILPCVHETHINAKLDSSSSVTV